MVLVSLAATPDGRSILRGTMTLDYRTTERVVVLNLPGQAKCQFRPRLAGEPLAFPAVRAVASGRWYYR